MSSLLPFRWFCSARNVVLIIALGAPVGLIGQQTSYQLFVGMDLLVPRDEEKLQVASIKRNRVVVDHHNSLDEIPLREVGAFSWKHAAKVSRAPVEISGLEFQRSITVNRDTAMNWMRAQNNLVTYAQERTAYQQAIFKHMELRTQTAGPTRQIHRTTRWDEAEQAPAKRGLGHAGDIGLAQLDPEMSLEQASDMLITQFEFETVATDSTLFSDRQQEGIAAKQYDVLELNFSISSREPIADAYVVVMGEIVQDDETGVVTFHQNIGRLDSNVRKITLRKTGFEPGFEVNAVKLHVYTHGKELGTNLSEKEVALTREQAREFLLLAHLSENTHDSLHPKPVWELMPLTLLAASDREAFDYSVVVNIDADGSVISIHNTEGDAQKFLDTVVNESELRTRATTPGPFDGMTESVRIADQADIDLDQTGRLPAHISATIADMVFLPALEIGKPVAGIATINLAEFFR